MDISGMLVTDDLLWHAARPQVGHGVLNRREALVPLGLSA